jgi:GDP-D-mannose dehydratase
MNQRLLMSGPRGNIAKALTPYMRREHPEVGIDTITPFPFLNSALVEKLKGGTFTHFVNCAALGSDSESVENPRDYFRTNVEGVTNQLEMIRLYSPKTRYLNLGTVYEQSDSGTPYVCSKRMARQVVCSYRESHDLFAVTATLGFTEYYDRADNYLSRKITKGVARIAAAIKAGLPFDPVAIRDRQDTFCWTWAEDVADGIWKTLNENDPFDTGLMSDEFHAVGSFARMAFEEAGLPAIWVGQKLQNHFRAPDGETRVYAENTGDGSEFGENTNDYGPNGWAPKFKLRDIVREMTLHDLKQVGL